MQELTSREWLCVNIANHNGLDKVIWNNRIEWVLDNYKDLENLADEEAHPFQYQEAVKDLRAWDKGKEVNLPIFLDASASGMSIMSVLRHDRRTAIATNVISTGQVNDPYGSFARIFHIDRQSAKEALMPFFYSSIKTPLDIIGEARFGEFLQMVEVEFPGPVSVLRTLESLHRSDVSFVEWEAPDRHKCHVKYLAPVDKSIETASFGKFTYRMYLPQPTDNYRKVAANFIQSIDAWIAREMIRRAAKQKFEILPIHDAFGCLPMHVNKMRRNYLDILQDLARWDPAPALNSISGGQGIWTRFGDEHFIRDIQGSEYALC